VATGCQLDDGYTWVCGDCSCYVITNFHKVSLTWNFGPKRLQFIFKFELNWVCFEFAPCQLLKLKSTYDELSNSQDPKRRMRESSWSMNWEGRKTKRSRNTAQCTTPWSRNTAQCRTPSQTETPPSTEHHLVRTGAKIRGLQREKPTTTPQNSFITRGNDVHTACTRSNFGTYI
jgi:hypothetical protein